MSAEDSDRTGLHQLVKDFLDEKLSRKNGSVRSRTGDNTTAQDSGRRFENSGSAKRMDYKIVRTLLEQRKASPSGLIAGEIANLLGISLKYNLIATRFGGLEELGVIVADGKYVIGADGTQSFEPNKRKWVDGDFQMVVRLRLEGEPESKRIRYCQHESRWRRKLMWVTEDGCCSPTPVKKPRPPRKPRPPKKSKPWKCPNPKCRRLDKGNNGVTDDPRVPHICPHCGYFEEVA